MRTTVDKLYTPMASTISSVMVLDSVILQHHRLHHFERSSLMENVILLTSLSCKNTCTRWGTPEDLEGPAVFLASDASDFVNGHILYVEGGILAYIGK